MDLTENMINQPGKEILFAHRASNLLKAGEIDEAIKVCEKGLKQFPTYAQAHYILARCYIRKKHNDEARAELERVLRYEPGHIKAIRDLAGLHFANEFQDLYREYLMKLFTLDPMNEKVIEEAKKLGEYKLWQAQSAPAAMPDSLVQPEKESESSPEDEHVFLDTEKEVKEKTYEDPIFPDKIDLSQFDNVEDDFTTILHGKMEYSGKINQSKSETRTDLSDIAKDIIEEPMEDDYSASADEADASPGGSSPVPNSDTELSFDENLIKETDDEPLKNDATHATGDNISSENDTDSGFMLEEAVTRQEMGDSADTNIVDYDDEEIEKFEQPKIISQTLGEILVSQQKYVEAKAVFEALKEKQPENRSLDLKIEYLNRIIGLEKDGKS